MKELSGTLIEAFARPGYLIIVHKKNHIPKTYYYNTIYTQKFRIIIKTFAQKSVCYYVIPLLRR